MSPAFGEIKSKKVKKFIKKLVRKNKTIIFSNEGKHYKIKINDKSSFPLPLSHVTVNKYIIEKFGKWLVVNNICTEEEFLEGIK